LSAAGLHVQFLATPRLRVWREKRAARKIVPAPSGRDIQTVSCVRIPLKVNIFCTKGFKKASIDSLSRGCYL
jgi:hypothetical protein